MKLTLTQAVIQNVCWLSMNGPKFKTQWATPTKNGRAVVYLWICVLKTLPVTPAQPIARTPGCLRQRGSSDSAPARFCVPPLPPPDDCQCAFPIGKKEWEVNRGERRSKRGSEGASAWVRTEWETRAKEARGNFTRGILAAHRRPEEIALERSVLESVKKWSVDERTSWNARFTHGLSGSTVRTVPAWRGADTGKQADSGGKLPTMEMHC